MAWPMITDLHADDEPVIERIAALLVAGFAEHHPDAWPDLDSARAEVRESLDPGRISRIARAEDGTVVGWIGGISQYDGHVWELHPLVVDPARQGEGIGRALVRDFEDQVRAHSGLTILLGTDDETGQTSLANANLYPNVWEHIRAIHNLRRHPYEFYQKQGYVIVGVIPDANGPGKPDILMAKPVPR
jgi:aminoglycoside 6'-N-acetyltransferase I